MSAAESAPAVSRPEGGWRDGDQIAVVLDGGRLESFTLDDGQWRSVSKSHPYRVIRRWMDEGQVVYVHAPREPEPVMEPLPSTPCAIRATVRGVKGVLLVGPDDDDEWVDLEGTWNDLSEITAWEPLLSRAEWEAEQDGDTVRGGRS